MSKRVFLVTDVSNINVKASPDLLGAGEIGLFGINADTQRNERAEIGSKLSSFRIAIGRGTNSIDNILPFWSPTIELPVQKRNLHWQKATYDAPVKHRIQVTTDCRGKNAYDEFQIKAAVKDGNESGWLFMRTYAVNGAYAADGIDLYAALAAMINNDVDGYLDATSSSGGVVITPKNVNHLIRIGFEFNDNESRRNCQTCTTCNGFVTELNAPYYGEGTYDQLMQHLYEARGYIGQHWREFRDIPLPSDGWGSISSTSTWDFYFLNDQNHHQSQGDAGLVAFDIYQENIIAVPAGTAFEAITQVITTLINEPLDVALV